MDEEKRTPTPTEGEEAPTGAAKEGAENTADANADAAVEMTDAAADAADAESEADAAADESEAEAEGETADEGEADAADAPAKKAARTKVRRRLFLDANTTEWMGTMALCAMILQLGAHTGEAVQQGRQGLAALGAALSNVDTALITAALLGFGVLASLLGRRHAVRWLALPMAAYLGCTLMKLVRLVLPMAALWYTYGQLDAATAAALGNYARVLLPVLLVGVAALLLQAAAVISLLVLLFGRGGRVAHMVLCALWCLAAVFNQLWGLQGGTLLRYAPDLMMALGYVVMAVLCALPALRGKKVPLAQWQALCAADAGGKAASVDEADADEATGETDEADEAADESDEADETDEADDDAAGETNESGEAEPADETAGESGTADEADTPADGD